MVSSIIWTFYSSVKFSRYNLSGGDERNRTADPLLARQVLSQLSYAPNLLKVEPSKLNINLSECASTCRTQ